MRKSLKRISWIMSFLLLFSLFPQWGLEAHAATLKPVADSNGTVTFQYQGDASTTSVVVAGDWNNFDPKNGDQMTEGANHVWSVTTSALPPGDHEYKLVVDGNWMTDPANLNQASGNSVITVPSPTGTAPVANSDGTVTFKYTGGSDTTSVVVAGDWNNWDPKNGAKMTKGDNNVWTITTAPLSAGDHEYKFAINGGTMWVTDPGNTKLSSGNNSVITVPQHVGADPTVNADNTATFQYQGNDATQSVNVAGDWNGWSATNGDQMTKGTTNIWSVKTGTLPPGQHEYKFVVDGSNWMTDPNNATQSSGGNSVVNVPGFYKINAQSQIQQNTSVQLTGVGLKADGTDEDLTGIDWSVSPSTAATVDASGQLTAKALPSGTSSQDVTITGVKDGATVTKDIKIVDKLTEVPGGKDVVVAGDIQSTVQKSAWDPASAATRMLYQGNGLYTLTLKNVPQGNYQYKVAIGGSWADNYGANAAPNGGNLSLSVTKDEDVTFYYSDSTHIIVDSTTYTPATPVLSGSGVPAHSNLVDYNLTGVYSTTLTLNQGTYNDLKITDGDKTIAVNPITISNSSESVTISYDEVTGIVFNNLSTKSIDTSSLYFNSKDAKFKSIYGAVTNKQKVTFNLQSKKGDLTDAKLVMQSGDGTQVIDMKKDDNYSSGQYEHWTTTYSPSTIGLYHYYFVVTNGFDVKAYGDDDGYYGPGKADNIGKVGKYEMTVYDSNFQTPDWMKNAVIYQIFPDRFFNGDPSNDYANQLARGTTPFEFSTDWNSIPEDPNIEYKTDANGNVVKDAKGNPVIDPTYKANVGDGLWNNDVFGGDLKGIQDRLNYLKALGVNTLYLNPISSASSNHRYDTRNYKQVDPMLGTMQDYANLISEAHKMGMHIILDGVFNHVSDDSVYFDRYGKYVKAGQPIGAYQYWSRVYDMMNANSGMTQQQAETKVQANLKAQGITDFHYKDWFIVKNVKDANGVYEYNGWNGDASLPEIQALNNSEYNVTSWANDLISGPNSDAKFWLNQGSDGWRLDAADSMSDDVWKHFRPVVKNLDSSDVIVGEIWGDSSKYLLGNMFDSVMNYQFRTALQEFVTGTADATKATNDLEKIREEYPAPAFDAMMNIVDSHDTERIISDFAGIGNVKAVAPQPTAQDLAKMKLVPFIQMTYPGAPTIYYGDEIGMPGAGDPDSRRPMAWGKGNKNLVEWYAQLANIRDTYSVLRTGDLHPLTVDSTDSKTVMAYQRDDSSNHAVVVANRDTNVVRSLTLSVSDIPDGTVLTNALDRQETYTVQNGKVTVTVPAQSGIILVNHYEAVKVDDAALAPAFDPSYIVKDRVLTISVSLKDTLTLELGHRSKLSATVAPTNATLKAVNWSSSDPSVAKVNSDGMVTAVGKGQATITATTVDSIGKVKAQTKVTVVPASEQGNGSGQTNKGNGNDSGTGQPGKTVTATPGNSKAVAVKAGETLEVKGTNANVQLPANLPSGTTVKVTKLDPTSSEVKKASNLKVAGDIYHFDFTYPKGHENFTGSFKLTLSYDVSKFSSNQVGIYYFNENTQKWEFIGGKADAANGTITVSVPHFSTYGVFTRSSATSSKTSATSGTGSLPNTSTPYPNVLAGGILIIVLGGLALAWMMRRKNRFNN